MSQISLLHIDDSGVVRTDRRCTLCDFSDDSRLQTNCMAGSGPVHAQLMFVGHAPAEEDDHIGKPMTGRGGRIFKELLQEGGITPSEVYITNVLKCCLYGKEPKEKHFKACTTHLLRELQQVRPDAIVSVGAWAWEHLTGLTGLLKFRRHGAPCRFLPGVTVYPIVQPASVFYGSEIEKTEKRKEIVSDIAWIARKAQEGTLSKLDSTEADYRMARDMDDVLEMMIELEEAPGPVAVDLECGNREGEGSLWPETGWSFPCAFGFSTRPGHGRAIPLYCWGTHQFYYWADDQVEEILRLISVELKTKPVFGHNWLQYDQKWIKHFFPNLPRTNVVFDTMLAHYLVDEEKGTHDLQQLAVRYTQMAPWKQEFTVRDVHQMCQYLCKDVDATYRIKEAVEPLLTEKQAKLLKRLLIPLGHELMEMEYRGVRVDQENLTRLSSLLDKRIEEELATLRLMPEVQAYELTENTAINVDNHRELAKVMELYLQLPVVHKTAKGQYSTGKPTLEHYKDHPFVQGVQQIRGLGKLKGTYVDGMQDRMKADGRIHTSYLIHGTDSGRLASRDPNLQNLPRDDNVGKVLEEATAIKRTFAADIGYRFLQADFGQIELRVLAMKSKDPNLIDIFKQGLDVHRAVAARVYGVPLEQVTKGQRSCAKNVVFGVNYGMSEESLIYKFVQAGNTEAEAKEFLRYHKQTFSVVWDWVEEQRQIVQKDKIQETFFGRRRHYQWVDNHMLRVASNYPIQSEASDFTLFSIVRTARALRELGYDAYPLLTVHDSIIFQVLEEQLWDVADVVKHLMEGLDFSYINVPIKVDLEAGLNWGELRKIDLDQRVYVDD
jgi:uracil-DNA glycosylase family 4